MNEGTGSFLQDIKNERQLQGDEMSHHVFLMNEHQLHCTDCGTDKPEEENNK